MLYSKRVHVNTHGFNRPIELERRKAIPILQLFQFLKEKENQFTAGRIVFSMKCAGIKIAHS